MKVFAMMLPSRLCRKPWRWYLPDWLHYVSWVIGGSKYTVQSCRELWLQWYISIHRWLTQWFI